MTIVRPHEESGLLEACPDHEVAAERGKPYGFSLFGPKPSGVGEN